MKLAITKPSGVRELSKHDRKSSRVTKVQNENTARNIFSGIFQRRKKKEAQKEQYGQKQDKLKLRLHTAINRADFVSW